jgi:hypothetical protein
MKPNGVDLAAFISFSMQAIVASRAAARRHSVPSLVSCSMLLNLFPHDCN